MTDKGSEFFPVENNKEDTIDLLNLSKILWNRRKLIVRITIAFIIIGLLIALLSAKQ
jgi:uncharacterized protein involved in exopolysaccharide biosynthesis